MTEPNAGKPEIAGEEKLPRRDWILLPAIALLTMFTIACSSELIARRTYWMTPTGLERCLRLTDATDGVRAIPNSVCWDKHRDTPLTEYRINGCGFRSSADCGPAKPGAYRIVMLGSSFAMGQWIPVEQSTASLLPEELTRQTGHRVELYNESMLSEHLYIVPHRFREALAAKPDMVLWVISPFDFGVLSVEPPSAPDPDLGVKGRIAKAWIHARRLLSERSLGYIAAQFWHRATEGILDSASGVMLQDYLYRNHDLYIDAYLRKNDLEGGYLRTVPSAQWQVFIAHFRNEITDVAGQARTAGVPLVVFPVPTMAQAFMISKGEWPSGVSPYQLRDTIRPLVESQGATYIDVLPEFRTINHPEKYYFPVDSHPNKDGHALLAGWMATEISNRAPSLISRMLTIELTGGAVPELKGKAPALVEPGQER